MNENDEKDLLIGSLATRVGLVAEQVLADSLRLASDGSESLGELIRQKAKLDDETWESLTQLAEKHSDHSSGSITDSLGNLYRQTSRPSKVVMDALKESADENAWNTLLPDGDAKPDADDGYETIVTTGQRTTSDPMVGQQSKRFQKIREHAAGGLGQVFVAIDDELNRQVALKQIRERYSSDTDARQRFILEAEITGGLEHPGIVPVYGLGIYQDGQPYYAMRFIRGQSMQAAIEALHQKSASTHGRWTQSSESMFELRKLLSRVIDVCQAIGYAHSRGVLHRDIKPDNIMLGDYGETLVVDWGLAKVEGETEGEQVSESEVSSEGKESKLSPASGSGTAPTQVGRVVGTLGFMSPEQATGAVDEIDCRSDVYSLGASLYSVLVGHPTIGSKNEKGKSRKIEEMLDATRSGNFQPPLQAEASIPKPLAAICERAMALAPESRYESATEMADDLERWLADEPVHAYEETPWEKSRRWVRQHQTLTASAAAVVMVSIVGLGGFSLILNQKNTQLTQLADSLQMKNTQLDERGKELRQSNEELLIAEAKARDEAETSKAVTEFLNDDLLSQASSQDHPDPNLQVRTVLDRAAEELNSKFANRPMVKANLLKTIGVAYGYLGEFAKSEESLSEAVTLFAEHMGENHPTTIVRRSELGRVMASSGKYKQGKAALESALTQLIELHGIDHKDVIDTQAALADLHTWLGDYEAAERLINQAIAGNTRLLGRDDADTLGYENSKATIWNYTFRWKQAVVLGEDLLSRAEAALGENHVMCLDIMTGLAQSYFFDGKYDEAETTYDQALLQSTQLLGELHPGTLTIRHDLAQLDAYRGNPGRALVELQNIRQLSSKNYGQTHRETLINDQSVASVLAQLGRLEEARDLLVDTLTRAESSLADSPETELIRFDLGLVYFELEENDKAEPILKRFANLDPEELRPGNTTPWDARVLLSEIEFDADRFDQAIELLKQAREGYGRSKTQETTMSLRCVNDLLWSYVLSDQTPKAERLIDEIVESREMRDHETTASILSLIDALIEVGDIETAEARVDGLTEWSNGQVDPDQETLVTMVDLAATLSNLGMFEDSILQYQRVLARQTQLLGNENIDTLDTVTSLAITLEDNGEADKAAEVYEQLLVGETKVYGEQSNQVVLTLGAIANLRIGQDQYQEAIEPLKRMRHIQEQMGSFEETDVRVTDQKLATAYRRTGDYANAIEHYETVMEGTDASNDDADLLLTLHQLAWCYGKNKQSDQSIATYRRVVQGRTRVLGSTHQHTLFSLGNLAYALALSGHANTKQTLSDLESRVSAAETNAPGTDQAAYMLGESYRLLQQYDSAVRWYRTCVDLRKASMGKSSPLTLLAMHQVAYTLSLSKDYHAAAQVYAEVVPLREQVLGKSHEYTMQSLMNWGVVEAQLENYPEAIRLLEDGLQRVVQAKGKEAPNAIQPRVTLAAVHHLEGNYTRAIQLSRDTLEVTYRNVRKSSDTIERELAMLQIALADSELHAGRLDDAFQHATEGLNHRVDPNPINFYRAKSILGAVQAERGETEKGREILNVAVEGFDSLVESLGQDPANLRRLRLQIDAVTRMIATWKESENNEEIEKWRTKLKSIEQELTTFQEERSPSSTDTPNGLRSE